MARLTNPRRRGLVLLIVLGMLALFSLLVVTYVVFSSDSSKASLALAKSDYRARLPNSSADEVVRLLVRGTENRQNPLYQHDLLRDLYGRGAVAGVTVGNAEILNNSIVVLQINLTLPTGVNISQVISGALSGRILTFTEGPLSGASYPIAAHDVVVITGAGGPQYENRVVLDCGDVSGLTAASFANISFYINDKIFDGAGLSSARVTRLPSTVTNVSTLGSKNIPISFLPNHPMLLNNFGYDSADYTSQTDESFDAADYNDFYLAHPVMSAEGNIPSFHRPELLHYLAARYGLGTGVISRDDLLELVSVLETATLRPLSYRIRYIDSTNVPREKSRNPNWRQNVMASASTTPRVPTLDLNLGTLTSITNSTTIQEIQAFLNFHCTGPWDVDTDGDLIPDAIWIDPGLAMQTAASGKLLKPMAAIQILPLDGRLDLNAVADPWQAESNSIVDLTDPNLAFLNPILSLSNNRPLLQGTGLGPADIGIEHLFRNKSAYLDFFEVRYSPRNGAATANLYSPGLQGNDLASQYRELETRNSHQHAGLPGFPRNIRGRQAMGIDKAGNLVTINLPPVGSNTAPGENEDDPYESRVLTGAHGDSGFTLAELERVIRRSDSDYAMLPSRLEDTLVDTSGNPLAANSGTRNSITTRSSSINTISPGVNYSTTVADHPVYKWLAENVSNQGGTLTPAAFQALFPIEFRTGQKLNLNRLLGNGEDDNSNGDIDEPIEWFVDFATVNPQSIRGFSASLFHYLGGRYPYGPGAPLLDRDVSNVGPIQFTGMETRQLLAREIYCLLQAIVPTDYVFPGALSADDAYRARRLAQWAVNIVDFRDSDSACTRFVYDIRPFNNSVWDLSMPSETGIVWGLEQPELLLTENMSFHDRRVKDTKIGSEGRVEQDEERDPNMDQYRIPQGTSIFELYVPRTTGLSDNTILQGVSGSLYTTIGTQVALNLNAFAPGDGVHPAQPVWRLAISEMQQPGETPDSFFQNAGTRRNYSYQPNSATEASQNGLPFDYANPNNVPDAARLERFVYFSTSVPNEIPMNGTWEPSSNRAYWNKTANVTASGGQYIVVAPRATTYLGMVQSNAQPPTNLTSPQGIQVDVNNSLVRLSGIDGALKTDTTALPVKSVVGLIATGETPTALKQQWDTAFPDGIGVSISEPLPGDNYSATYSVPTMQLNSNDRNAGTGFGDLPPDSYHDFYTGTGAFPDTPFDEDNDSLPSNLETRTHVDIRTVYLQRLADPSRPYHVTFNPYIAVDWMPMDLTVFNGEDDVEQQLSTMNGPIHKDPKDPPKTRAERNDLLKFGTRFRSDGANLSHYYTYRSERAPDSVNVVNNNAFPVYFPYEVSRNPNGVTVSSLGFANVGANIALLRNPAVTGYEGVLNQEYCSLPWFNRSFSSPLELALVPISGPGQLHQEFSPASLSSMGQWYSSMPPSNSQPFGHLPPIYSTTDSGTSGANLYALFSFVEVPPQWSEYYKTINPTELNTAMASVSPAAQRALMAYVGPFSQIPFYRHSGKVNVNAISQEEVWRGLEWNTLNSTGRSGSGNLEFWQKFQTSMLGQAGFSPSTTGTDPFGGWVTKPSFNFEYPTRFAGAFKEPAQAAVVPLSHLERNPIDVTLLRSNRSGPIEPLFLRSSSNSPFNQSKHSHALFQDTVRLANITTTHSNVYAVWITIGYFEWSESEGLLQEYKASSGENSRHRSFYIIDRSIPVGYVPGQDLNVNQTVLIRRYLE